MTTTRDDTGLIAGAAESSPSTISRSTRNTLPSVVVLVFLTLTLAVTSIAAYCVVLIRFVVRIPCYITDAIIYWVRRRKVPITPEHGYAVVTGASSGIGQEIAIELARKGYDLVLVARREERLSALETQFEQEFGIQVLIVPLDLSKAEAATTLHQKCHEAFPSRTCALLINNAGHSALGDFAEQSEELIGSLISVNVISTVKLTRAFLPDMLAEDRGRILVVSSIMGQFPNPYNAVYAGTKAFLSTWAMSLTAEIRDSGVALTCVEPGGTKTEFFDTQGGTQCLYAKLPVSMTARKVALQSLDAMFNAKSRAVIGIQNQWSVLANATLTQECQLLACRLCWMDV